MSPKPRVARAARVIVAFSLVMIGGWPFHAAGARAASPDDLDAIVRDAMEASAIPGIAYAVIDGGEIVHLAGFGTAGPGDRPMTPQTPVVIGSVAKSITALAIRQLVAAGQVDLDAPVTSYLPWFTLTAPPDAVARVTIRSLLDHTSGLSKADGQDASWYQPGRTSEEIVRALAGVGLRASPAGYEYSNLNYVILGVVVEAVSGVSYGAYLEGHIFGPLDMTHSFTDLEAAAVAGPAQGHRYLFGLPVAFDEPYPTGMVPAGYHVSTAEDMAHFVLAMTSGGIYEGVNVVPGADGSGQRRGYATDWGALSASQADAIVGQSGSTLTSNADLLTFPSRRAGVVVLLNANPTQLLEVPAGAADIARAVMRGWAGAGPPSTAPDVRSVYVVVDLAICALAALLVAHAWRARSWRHRLATTRHRGLLITRTVVADLLMPVAVLVGLPLLIGSTGSSRAMDVQAGWAFALWTLPDLALAILAMSIGGLLVGAVKVATVRMRPGGLASWPRLEGIAAVR